LLIPIISTPAQELYWEDPEVLVSSGSRFPSAKTGGGLTAVAWQEFEQTNGETGEITLSILTKTEEGTWQENRNFAGPYTYTGKPAPIFSMTVDKSGRVLIAVSSNDRTVTVLSSTDGGASFSRLSTISADSTLVTPRIFEKSDGGFLLFATQEWVTEEGGDALSIFYTLSSEGRTWSELEPLVSETGKTLNFLPHHTSAFGNEYVAFQILETEEGASYQTYLKISEDGGRSWSAPKWISGFEENLPDGENGPLLFNNQRPYIARVGNRLAVAWERSYRRENPQIYFAELDRNGTILGEPERVTSGDRYCNYPQIIVLGEEVYLLWFDDRAGDEHIILANKSGAFWDETDLSRMDGISMFPRPIVREDKLYITWENRRGASSRLIYLQPDETVSPPTPQPQNFIAGERASQDRFSVQWTLPEDSSGIAGFSYAWSKSREEVPEQQLMTLRNQREAVFTAEEDGEWYFHVRAQDYAGNWSGPSTISVFRDTTPPGRVTFFPPDKDDRGFLSSNTFSIRWDAPEEEENIAGYSYSLQYLGPLQGRYDTINVSLRAPSGGVLTRAPLVSFVNRDNGYWAMTVRAIDSVGNVGPAETIFFKMNKYIPVTYITDVSAPQDELGRISMQIRGRGFSVGGRIETVILDRDGEPPYDYTFPGSLDIYSVVNDRLIVGPEIEDIDEGVYRVGVVHPSRGTYFTGPLLDFEATGAVKFGDYRTRLGYGWQRLKEYTFSLSANNLVLLLVLSFLTMVVLFSSVKVVQLVNEGRKLQYEVRALIFEREIPARQKRERLYAMKKHGIGLRFKFTLFITTILISIVLGVSFYLGNFMIQTQRKNLAEGLRQQTQVLLESLAAGARENLPRKDILALDGVISQRTAMDDALYATITGQGEVDPDQYGYIWATDDPNIQSKIEGEDLTLGRTRIDDPVSSEAERLSSRINEEAREELSQIAEELDRLGDQAVELALRDDEESARLLEQYQQQITELENRLNERLLEIGDITSSVPRFEAETLSEEQTRYIFYKPVVYASRGEQVYYRGLVRVGVSIERILTEINNSREDLIITTLIIAAIASGVGVVGALLFASIMIIPITRLVQGVEKIRDTEDKEQLKDHQIAVRSKDEISTLAETVNQMTQGLVKAAVANKDLIVGKEVQKMFIPLKTDSSGKKLTTGKEENDKVSFFGYYEGAKGVSGDYFDFSKLDDKHYAIIKCDVAGKGVPASLIMVEVATIFLNYFRNWSLSREGIDLSKLLYNMNDLIEERGFKGRFAALIVAVLNVETGTCYFCNAGDNIVHIYDSNTRSMGRKMLPETPATGVFPSMLVEMQSGFQQVPHQLKVGDTMFLFTDGIEEAQRKFRDSSFNLTTCQEPGIGEGEAHGNHNKGSGFEELGIPRIYDVVNAVFNKGRFKLEKYHNQLGDEDLEFDFSTCENTVEQAVLAMVAVEKIFRIYPDPAATDEDRVQVDRVIDEFLRQHFLQYDSYFTNPVESGEESEYMYYARLKEDEQFDDLTILGVKKL
jgi:hypothetical protein